MFCFIGKPGAGKDTAIGEVRAQISRYPTPMFQFSDPINECLLVLHLEKSRPNQQKFSTGIRELFGQDLLSNILYERIMQSESWNICVGGIRRLADIVKLRTLAGFRLIFVTASPEVRWQRIRLRDDRPGDAELTWEDFLKQDNAEPEQLINELGKQADYVISNDANDMGHLRNQVTAILTAEGLA